MSMQSGRPKAIENLVDLPLPQLRGPRELGLDAIRAAGGAHRALEQLAERLEQRANRMEAARDPACVFARAYAELCRRLADGLHKAGWSDPSWVALLTMRMAEQYLRALNERAAGTHANGVWASNFEASDQRETSVREELVLGLTACLVHDLPLALCEAGMLAPNGESHLRDYHDINEVWGQAIEDIAAALTRRYEPWLGAADQMPEAYASVLTNQGLRIARATAWYNAQRLQDPALAPRTRAALSRWSDITLYELLHPPVWSMRFVARGARLLSRVTRSFPGLRAGMR
jgi:hypothetical protein